MISSQARTWLNFASGGIVGHFYVGIWWLFFRPLKNIYSGGSHLAGKDNGQVLASNISVLGDDSLLQKVHLFFILTQGKQRNPICIDHGPANYTLCAKPVHCPFLYMVCEFKSVVYTFKPLEKRIFCDMWNLHKVESMSLTMFYWNRTMPIHSHII